MTKCPIGQYQPETGRDFCLRCPPGYFCATEGLSVIDDSTMKCSPGHTCTSSSITATPFAKSYGDQCEAGYYCDEGSAYQTECPPGLACPNAGMQMSDLTDSGAYTGTYFCEPGYYCTTKATTKTPNILNEGGGICPAGHYCPSPDPENSN